MIVHDWLTGMRGGERVLEEGRTPMEWWEHPEADPFAVLGLLPGASLDEAAAARRRVELRVTSASD